MPRWRVPLVDLGAQHRSIAGEVMPAVEALVEHQTFILGEPVARFERTLAALCGVEHAVGVASGTDALELALRAMGIGVGDGVVTSAFSFVATAEAIVAAGANPIFADVEGFNLSAASLEQVLAAMDRKGATLVDPVSGAVMRAVVPVHLFGECAPMEAVGELAARNGLAVIEDAAQAIGAVRAGRRAGSFGDAATLSFFPSKNLGGWGDGGAVVTSEGPIAERVRRLRAHGGVAHESLGTNSRLDALQAVVLDVKARHLDAWTAARGRAAMFYREQLGSLADKVTLPPREGRGDRHAYHQFVLRAERRDALLEHLRAWGIEARAYYPRALHHEPCFAPFVRGDARFPRAEHAARTAIGIPIYPEITQEQQGLVVAAIVSFYA